MRYDPQLRLTKYDVLRNIIRHHGYQTWIPVEQGLQDGLSIWSGSEPPRPRPPGQFWVLRRPRGWFISAYGPRDFKVDVQANIESIALMLAKAAKEGRFEDVLADLVRHKLLAQVDGISEDFEEERLSWEKSGWSVLTRAEEDLAWEEVDRRFITSARSLQFGMPTLTWDLPKDLDIHSPEFMLAESSLTLAVLDGLRRTTLPNEYVLALDFNHPCYRFYPHQGVRQAFRDYWAVPVWPEGDSYQFMAPNFEFGVWGEWVGKFHVFGLPMINALGEELTKVLGPPISSPI